MCYSREKKEVLLLSPLLEFGTCACKDIAPKESLLQEAQAEKHEGFRIATHTSSQDLTPGRKASHEILSGLGKDGQYSEGGQNLNVPQVDLPSAISALCISSFCQVTLSSQRHISLGCRNNLLPTKILQCMLALLTWPLRPLKLILPLSQEKSLFLWIFPASMNISLLIYIALEFDQQMQIIQATLEKLTDFCFGAFA